MNVRQQNIKKRRQRILQSARQIVAEKGPEGLNMRSLAKQAGFSVTTLYNHFGNKDDLLVALLEDALNEVTPLIEMESKNDPFSAVVAVMTGPVSYLIENSKVLRPIMAVEYYKAERRAAPYALEIYAGILNTLAQLLEAAQKQGFFIKTVSPYLLAAEIFYSFRLALEDWELSEINDDALVTRVQSGVLMVLLSAATEKSRLRLQKKLKNIQSNAVDDLFTRFPALKTGYGKT